MYIAICEDQASDEERLRKQIEEYCRRHYLSCRIESFCSGEAFLASFSTRKYNLIFLDVYMGEFSGIEIARAIRGLDGETPLVFVTSSLDHALEGFAVNALHYLVKPVMLQEIHDVFARSQRFLQEKQEAIEVMSNRLPVRIPVVSISYIEVYAKLCTIHCEQGLVKTYTAIDALASSLTNPVFLRTHRSYIVNMRYIKAVEADVFRLFGGESVPIRQNGRAEIKRQYMNYLLKTVRAS